MTDPPSQLMQAYEHAKAYWVKHTIDDFAWCRWCGKRYLGNFHQCVIHTDASLARPHPYMVFRRLMNDYSQKANDKED